MIYKTLFQRLLWDQSRFFVNVWKICYSFQINLVWSCDTTVAVLLFIIVWGTFILRILLDNTLRFNVIIVQIILFAHFRIFYKTFISLRTSRLAIYVFVHIRFIVYIYKTSFDLVYLWSKFLAFLASLLKSSI